MNIQTSLPEPDSTGQLERLLQFAADYTPEQPAPDDLMARAMARRRQPQASSREGRRTVALLSAIGLALLFAAIGLSVVPRHRGTISGRSAPRVVGRVRRDLTAIVPHPASAPFARRPGREGPREACRDVLRPLLATKGSRAQGCSEEVDLRGSCCSGSVKMPST